MSPDTVRRLEHGAFSPSLATLTKLCEGLSLAMSTLFASFELTESDSSRELADLLATRSPREIKLACRVLRVLFDELDDRPPPIPDDEPSGDEPSDDEPSGDEPE